MPKLAFSTVATPEWPLDRVLSFAETIDVDAVELRTFGSHATDFACDPGAHGRGQDSPHGDESWRRRLLDRHRPELR